MLSVNVKKTKFMLFHNVGRNINSIIPEIKLKNITVERVEYFNFLGVTLDQHLNWKAHMDNVAIKISKYNGLLCKFKHFFPFTILYTLYNSLILPHLTYAILAWGNNSKSTYLFKIQKKVIRNVTNSKYNAHTEPLFKTLNLLNLDDIYNMFALKFYYNYCHKLLPHYFLSFHLTQRKDLYSYNIRTKHELNITKTNTKLAEKALRYALPKLVNNTTSNILDKVYTHSIQGYTFYVKQNLICKYSDICFIDGCYICNR